MVNITDRDIFKTVNELDSILMLNQTMGHSEMLVSAVGCRDNRVMEHSEMVVSAVLLQG